MRIATYNVEWFDALFDDAGRLLADGEWSARQDVTRGMQADALGLVFTAMDADAVLIVEAPDTGSRRTTVAALETFAGHYGLRTTAVLIGFPNATQQEIALIYDPAKLVARHDPRGALVGKKGDRQAPRFDGTFRIDLDIDDREDLVRWSKPPLELEILSAAGHVFRLIGVHAKSKAPHGATDPEDVLSLSIANRRKQLAQCIWLRQRVEAHLAAGEPLIVAGDFNDGPGLDRYESLFGRSGVEIVLGDDGGPALYDPHARAALQRRIGAAPTTARFWIEPENRWLSALLDYVMISADLCAKRPIWRIWHPFEDPFCYGDPALRDALF